MSSHSPRSELELRRHQLVRIVPAAWESLLRARHDLAREPLLPVWAARGWPLIARRRLPSDGEGLSLGLPLPPSSGKQRIAVQLPAAAVASVTSLPSLTEVLGTAPVAWRPHLEELGQIARDHGVRAGVFGSLAWQCLTGLTYLGPRSDLDIAWALPGQGRIDRLLDDLFEADRRSPVRLDGELIRADGAAVNWRELRAGAVQVAVKTITGVVLVSRAEFVGAGP